MYRILLTATFTLSLACADGTVQREPDAGAGAGPKAETPAADVTIEIPDLAAAGEIHGLPFTHEVAVIEDGILTLRQGEEFFPDLQAKVFLFLQEGEVPSGRMFEADAKSGPGLHPHVHLGWKDPPGSQMPQSAAFQHSDYTLRLELGEVAGKKLPGKIFLDIAGEYPTRVAGTFEADVRGFILVDGEADLTSDSPGLMKWLAERYLRQQHPGSEVEIAKYGATGLFGKHPERPDWMQHGWCDVFFQVDDGSEKVWRLQLAKGADGWAVHRQFETSAILAAHPLEEPRPDNARSTMSTEVARHLEADLGGRHAVYGFQTPSCTHNRILGQCAADYRLDDPLGQKVERAFLFERSGDGWRLARELAPDEKVNFKENRVEKKSGTP